MGRGRKSKVWRVPLFPPPPPHLPPPPPSPPPPSLPLSSHPSPSSHSLPFLLNPLFSQDILDRDMPDLPEFQPPQSTSDVSIELQIPAGLAEVGGHQF